jgi:cell wall-associated NlpC family hydrolase
VSYTDIARVGKPLGLAVILLAAIAGGACAAKGGVPRPFPVATRSPETGAILIEPAESPTESEAGGPPAAPAKPPAATDAEPLSGVLQTALEFLGIPYRNGGSDPSGFDCSGFVQYVFARHGTPLPREVRGQYLHGQTIDLDDVKPGDLVFFETVSRGASHVGIALGNGRFVHAPSSRGVVRVEPYTASYWARRFVGARRVVEVAVAVRGGFPGAIRSASTEP